MTTRHRSSELPFLDLLHPHAVSLNPQWSLMSVHLLLEHEYADCDMVDLDSFLLTIVELSWNCITPPYADKLHEYSGHTSILDQPDVTILIYIKFTPVPGSARRALVFCSYLVPCLVRCHIRMTSHPGDAACSCQDQDLISGHRSFCIKLFYGLSAVKTGAADIVIVAVFLLRRQSILFIWWC